MPSIFNILSFLIWSCIRWIASILYSLHIRYLIQKDNIKYLIISISVDIQYKDVFYTTLTDLVSSDENIEGETVQYVDSYNVGTVQYCCIHKQKESSKSIYCVFRD